MASRKRKKACSQRVSKDANWYIDYLTEDLIPDTVESRGADSPTVKDLRAGLAFIKGARSVTVSGHRYTPIEFANYLRETLIPDFEESGSLYAEDFIEIEKLIRATSICVVRY